MADFTDSIEEIDMYFGEYEGERDEKGARHGEGRAVFFNNDIYQGQFKDGKRHGFGTYTFANKSGSRYIGDYVDGKRQGEGMFCYSNGSTYEGNWVDGVRSGHGTYTYANGDEYTGLWAEDRRHGKGTYSYAETDIKYKGNFEYGDMTGVGQLITPQYRYTGVFDQGQAIGDGRYSFQSGCTQVGLYYERRQVTKGKDNQRTVTHVPQWKCQEMQFSLPDP